MNISHCQNCQATLSKLLNLHDGNTAETLAVLEDVDNQRLLRLEHQLQAAFSTTRYAGRLTSAMSLALRNGGFSIFTPPVSLPIFHEMLVNFTAEWAVRMYAMGQYPTFN